MGHLNSAELEEAEKRWDRLAESKGYRCAVCSSRIIYDDREVYFDRGLCSWDAHMADKDD